MTKIIVNFLLDFLESLVGGFIDNNLLSLAEKPFAIEESIKGFSSVQFSNIFQMFITIGISLIVVKFLKKGFDIYVLWTDGDADADPLQLVINFVRAIVIALTFTFFYKWFTELVLELTDDILQSIGLYSNINSDQFEGWFKAIKSMEKIGLSTIFAYIAFFLMYVIIYLKLIGVGFEILILRIGLPLACVGLMDADKGVFKSYIQKFIQVSFTIMVQVTITKLALSFLIAQHPIWALSAAYFAITTPKFIKEFLILSGGSGITNNAYQGIRVAQMVRSFVR